MEQQANATPEARVIVNFLRGSSQIPLRNGILGGTRFSYFHGTRAVAAMLSPQYAKLAAKSKTLLPLPKSEAEAEQILHNILPFAFFLRVERGDRIGGQKKPDGGTTEKMRELKIVQHQMFKKEMHYAWFYEGSQLRLQLMGLGMVVILLAGVMFPLWPLWMRQGVWYISVGLLGLIAAFFVLAIIRLILWACSSVVGKGFWLFPNLFADVGFVESFIPVWEWDVPTPAKKPKKSKKAAQQSPSAVAVTTTTSSLSIASGEGSGPASEVPGQAEPAGEPPVMAAALSFTKGKGKTSSAVSEASSALRNATPSVKPERESDKLADLD